MRRSSSLILVLIALVGTLVVAPRPAPAACGFVTPVQCVPNKVVGLGALQDVVLAKIKALRAIAPNAICEKICGIQGNEAPTQIESNENSSGTCKLQWRAIVTYNTNSFSGYDESGALIQCEMNMSYVETNMTLFKDSNQRRNNTHDPCDWKQAFEAGTSCRTVQNGYEAHTCSDCRGWWDVHWSAKLQLFSDEGYWYDWDPAYCTASQTVLTCEDYGAALI